MLKRFASVVLLSGCGLTANVFASDHLKTRSDMLYLQASLGALGLNEYRRANAMCGVQIDDKSPEKGLPLLEQTRTLLRKFGQVL